MFGNGGDDDESISSNAQAEGSTVVAAARGTTVDGGQLNSVDGEQLTLLVEDMNADEGPFNILPTIPPPLMEGDNPKNEGDNIDKNIPSVPAGFLFFFLFYNQWERLHPPTNGE